MSLKPLLSTVLVLLITACGVPVALSAPAETAVPVAQTPVLRVMTYNVCAEHANCPALRAWGSGRARSIAAAVKAAAPDGLTVEEAGGRTVEVPVLVRALAPQYVLVSGGRSRFLFVRAKQVDIHAAGQFQVQARGHADGTSATQARCDGHKTRASDSKPQCTSWALVSRLGTTSRVLVVGVHLLAYDGHRNDQDRVGEMRAILRHIHSQLKGSKVPIVVTGDFNSYRQRPAAGVDTDEARYRVHDYLTAHGMVDAVTVAATTVGADRNTLNPTPDDTRVFGVGRQLDHVYVPAGMTVTSWAVLDTPGAYADQDSDHDPLVVELSW